MSILIVDDSSLLREQLRNDLEDAGFRVVEGAGGEQGLEHIRRGLAPELIISDINMPNMGGLTFLERVNGLLNAQTPPIFVLSAERNEEARQRAQSLKVRAWIVKPHSAGSLIAAVRKVIGHGR